MDLLRPFSMTSDSLPQGSFCVCEYRPRTTTGAPDRCRNLSSRVAVSLVLQENDTMPSRKPAESLGYQHARLDGGRIRELIRRIASPHWNQKLPGTMFSTDIVCSLVADNGRDPSLYAGLSSERSAPDVNQCGEHGFLGHILVVGSLHTESTR